LHRRGNAILEDESISPLTLEIRFWNFRIFENSSESSDRKNAAMLWQMTFRFLSGILVTYICNQPEEKSIEWARRPELMREIKEKRRQMKEKQMQKR
jgi:hypothetical protein